MRYKDGINVGFSRGLKGKWKKSRINQNSTAVVFFLRYFSTDDVVIACEEQFFFKHFSLLFVARTVLSLSRSTQFLCVCAFFFSRSGRKCDHALGNGAWPVLFPFYWLFSGHYELFCFFLLAQFIGLFFSRIFPSSSGPDATRLDVRQDVAMATIDGVSLEERNGVIRPVFWLALSVKTLPFDFTSILRTVCRVFW